jgi:hypothetical protein
MRHFVVLLVLVATWSCAPASDRPADLPAPTPKPSVPMDGGLKSMVESAVDDAARRTGLQRAQLSVILAERVTWSDGSLGCPQPGVGYTQALVPGFRIRIDARGEVLDYHAGRTGPPVLCPPGRSTAPAPGGST